MSRLTFNTREPWKIIAVGGSRNWTSVDMIQCELNRLYLIYGKDMIIMTGDHNRGADRIARDLCQSAGVPYAGVPAWWESLGNKAGPVRNRWILRFQPLEVHLFIQNMDSSPGSRDMWRGADNHDIPVFVYRPTQETL